MNVVIACEFSGVVREAFRKLGHNAWSCDLLPAEDGSIYHHQDKIEHILCRPEFAELDLLIAHPPCTFLSNSGVKHLYIGGQKKNGRNEERWRDMAAAAAFFTWLLELPFPKICVENPIMHGHAKKLIGIEHTQIIQPWMFGHPETKATCLHLKGLPPLVPTDIVSGRSPRVHYESPGPDRWKRRSRTLQGVADAMAKQWGRSENGQDI